MKRKRELRGKYLGEKKKIEASQNKGGEKKKGKREV